MPIIKSEYIRRKLSYIKSIVEDDTKHQLYDINTSAEYIFMQILNDVYGWSLINANEEKPNFPAIDLIDTVNETVFQVTSEISTKKVREDTIEKFNELVKQDEYKKYAHYKIKMFYIKNKPNFLDKTLEEFASKGVPKSHLYGIEDINREVSANPIVATKVFKTLCEILHDKACDSDISPQLTTKLGKSTIIGREKELQEIDERLKASNTLLIKGIGGVGKSTIASNYLHRHKNEYDYYGFFEGLESFESELEGAFKLEIEQGQDRLDRVLRELIKLEPMSKKLLLIDDVKEIKENQKKLEKILGLEHNGYRVLLTSREEIEDVEQYDLDVLFVDDAKTLFTSIYEVKDELLLEEILGYLDCHAFFVEKVAQTLENKKGLLTLEDIKDKFYKNEFPDIRLKKRKSFNDLLTKLFNLDELEEDEVLLLKQLSVLPSIDIEFDFLSQIFQVDDRVEFQDDLDYLNEKGWLIYADGSYKLHQIIKEFILANYAPCFEEIEIIVDVYNQYLENSVDVHIAIELRKYIVYFDSIIKILKTMKNINEKIANLFQNTSHIFRNLGIYTESFVLVKNAIEIYKILFGDEHISTASSYNNLGLLYFTVGEYEEAKKLYEKSLYLTEKITDKKDMHIASIYNNLGEIHKVLGFYKQSEDYFLQALDLYEELLSEDNINRATIYNNLGEVYRQKVQYDIAYDYYMKSLKINESFFNFYHPNIALNYNNLGLLFTSMGKKEDAKKCYEKAILINNKIWGEEHSNVAMTYNNLAIYYQKAGLYSDAKEWYLKALSINKKILGNKHPFTIMNMVNLAELYRWEKLYFKAEPLFFEALDLYKIIWGEEHPDIASLYNNLGGLYFSLKKFDKAYTYMQKVYLLRKKFFTKNHPLLLQSIESLKIIERALNRPILNNKINRNDLCPCNSGKKYKKCCGKPK